MTIDDLAEAVGVPTRTIRYYITEGLLPGPEGRGKATAYTEEHLLRLRLIRSLTEQRVPLSEIRERLSRLSDEDTRVLLAEQDQLISELQRAAQTLAPREYLSGLLRRAREARPAFSTRLRPFSERRRGLEPPGGPARPAEAPDRSAIRPERREFPEPTGSQPPMMEYPGPQFSLSEAPASRRMQAEGTWYRWEIEPGVELHIRSDVVERYRYLIDILRRASGNTDV